VKGYPANPTTIGEAIRKRLLDLDLKQVEVAKLIGCDQLTEGTHHSSREMIGMCWQHN